MKAEDFKEVEGEVLASKEVVKGEAISVLRKPITNLENIPGKDLGQVRLVSYNITVDFFDKKDTTEDKHHHWKYREPFVKKLLADLYPDVMCLQEVSPDQAIELDAYFGNKGYKSAFLSQTPSELETGEIVYGSDVVNWNGKFVGTFPLGILVSEDWKFTETGRFWLNEDPDSIPQNTDRGTTDKGFGNANTYRAVLWTQIEKEDEYQNSLFVFNSHYPLSGGNKARWGCANIEMKKIKEIVKDVNWVSTGDRNIVITNDDDELYNPETVYKEFVKDSKDVRDSKKHYGVSTTWLGFSYDEYINKINAKTGDFEEDSVLDLMFSNLSSERSFAHHGAIDPELHELSDLSEPLTEQQIEGRYFSSDHVLIGGDFALLEHW